MNAKELYANQYVLVSIRPDSYMSFPRTGKYSDVFRGQVRSVGNRSAGGHLVRVWVDRKNCADLRLHGKNLVRAWTSEDEEKYNIDQDKIEFLNAKQMALNEARKAKAEELDLLGQQVLLVLQTLGITSTRIWQKIQIMSDEENLRRLLELLRVHLVNVEDF